ncbi:TIGR01620 family protein [Azospirillum halopraeferens]|uniref:TIGR01620 family protein n=1 Tax=Azospirillum halopraeferens TaxID=34010 RepID=UPI0004209FD4|nr:TIGR01620 family protein [Azospirillum halopraeferens]
MTESTRDRDWIAPMELDPDGSAPLPVEEEAPEPVPGVEPEVERLPAVRAMRGAGGSRVGRWLAGALAAIVAVALGFDTADLLARSFATSLALGVLVAAAVSVAVVSAGAMLLRELRSLRRLRRIEELRGTADRLEGEAGHGEGDRFAGALARLYDGRPDLEPVLVRLKDAITDAHDDAEVVRLIDREVLAGLDRAAYQLTLRASRDTAIATALSPAAVIDLAVVLWRNLKLVREIATLYGVRPGYFGSLRLLRRMLANLAVAGVAESAHHVAVDALGGSLAAAISTRVGQGVINGLLTARVGITAMHTCRPVAFGPHNRPSLGRIRTELLTLPKQVL